MTTLHYRTCHLCEANCGVVMELDGRTVKSVKGNPNHVLSRGYICPKATAIADIQEDPDRLRAPQKRTDDGWETISWEQAYREIGERFAHVYASDKSQTVFLGNPLTHNYAATTQMRNFIKGVGARGIYSASTLDQLPHMIAQRWVYGHNALYPVPNLDRSQFMLIVGGNPLASNGSLWTVPDVKKRLKDMQARGGKLVVIDPRRTETAKIADAHHFIRPGTDTAFFTGLLLSLDKQGLVNPGRLADMLDDGWAELWSALRAMDPAKLSQHCGIDQTDIDAIAAQLGNGQPAIVYGRMGVSVAEYGTVNHWLIQMLNIATGNLDREGGVMFGRPVIDPVQRSGTGSYGRYSTRLSGRPEVLGELPAAELADEILTPGPGQIGALFTVASNPVLSTPGGTQIDAALASLDLMVSVDIYVTETTRHAHYILPPCGPLEKDHYPLLLAPIAIRNFADYSSAAFAPEAGTKADWEILADLGQCLTLSTGRDAPQRTHPRKALEGMLFASDYDVSLTELEAANDGVDFGQHSPQLPGRLQTPDKRIVCAPPLCMEDLERFAQQLEAQSNSDALILIGRRHLRSNNSWMHNSHRLIKGPDRCTLMVHPEDAKPRGLSDGDIASISNEIGTVEVAVEITDDVMPGIVSLPHGYGHGRKGVKLSEAQARPGVSINDLTDPARLDRLSGNAVLNGVAVTVNAIV